MVKWRNGGIIINDITIQLTNDEHFKWKRIIMNSNELEMQRNNNLVP